MIMYKKLGNNMYFAYVKVVLCLKAMYHFLNGIYSPILSGCLPVSGRVKSEVSMQLHVIWTAVSFMIPT